MEYVTQQLRFPHTPQYSLKNIFLYDRTISDKDICIGFIDSSDFREGMFGKKISAYVSELLRYLNQLSIKRLIIDSGSFKNKEEFYGRYLTDITAKLNNSELKIVEYDSKNISGKIRNIEEAIRQIML